MSGDDPHDASTDPVVDTLNDVGVLTRREIEARIVAPLLDRLAEEFGRGVYEIARDVVVEVARRQGAELAKQVGGDSLADFARGLSAWSAGGALETEVIELTDGSFAFDVTRCRYAEMYRSLGLEDLGATLSCNRDGALIEGFNPDVVFTRTQTIMSGATHCDFRFRVPDVPVRITPDRAGENRTAERPLQSTHQSPARSASARSIDVCTNS